MMGVCIAAQGEFQPSVFHIYICNMVIFCGEELLAPLSNANSEGHRLLSAPDCLLNMLAPTIHIGGHSFICTLRMHHFMVTDVFVMGFNGSLLSVIQFG